MKNIIKISAMSLGCAFFMYTAMARENSNEESEANNENASYVVNNMDASITWSGSKITGGSHYGSMALKENSLEFMGNDLVGGSFVIDMNSMTVEDLSGSSAEKLLGHLKSDDFFGVSNYPESTLTISDVKAVGGKGEYKVTGDLTIKSTTLPISFPVQMTWEGNQAIATAKITVNRADFDVRYGSGRFFSGLGNKTIKDEFKLDVEIVSYIGD